jgi:hypothetical protein
MCNQINKLMSPLRHLTYQVSKVENKDGERIICKNAVKSYFIQRRRMGVAVEMENEFLSH